MPTRSRRRPRGRLATTLVPVLLTAMLAMPAAAQSDGPKRAALADPVRPIALDITTHLGDGQSFREGDPLSFVVSTDHDAYLLILYRDAAGRITQLLPNLLSGNSYYRAGEFIPVPGREAPFEFNISAPFGEEQVWAFSASEPFPLLPARDLGNGLRGIDGSLESVRQRLKSHAASRGAAFGEARLALQTRAAAP